MLSASFIPSRGDFAGQSFDLPPVQFGSYNPMVESDKQGTDLLDVAGMHGSWMTDGPLPSRISDTVYPVECLLNSNYVQSVTGGVSIGHIYTARAAIQRKVILGGLGTLVFSVPANFTIDDGSGNIITITSGRCTAKFNGSVGAGSYNETWPAPDNATIKLSYVVPSGFVTLSPGRFLVPLL